MATCRTCRGEYDHQQSTCPRCGSDVSAWEREPISLQDFLIKGGFLGLFPSILALLLWLFKWRVATIPLHTLMTTLLDVAAPALIFFGLFALRYYLWERRWAAQIYHISLQPLSMGVMIVGSFLILVVCIAVAYVIYRQAEPPVGMWERMVFTIFYALSFMSVAAGLTLSIIQVHLGNLERRVPQPIFVHTDRLLEIVLQTVERSLRRRNAPIGEEADRDLEVLEVVRNEENGGIQVQVREHRYVHRLDLTVGLRRQPRDEGRDWLIQADRWGRIRSLRPLFTQRVIGGE